jgi:hypothetical protein
MKAIYKAKIVKVQTLIPIYKAMQVLTVMKVITMKMTIFLFIKKTSLY